MRILRLLVQLIFLFSALLAIPARGTVIGPLFITDCPTGLLTISPTTITFTPPGTVAGTGCVVTTPPTSVTSNFGTIGAGVNLNIKNLTAGGGAVNDFITDPTISQIDYSLTGLTTPSAPSNGTNCTGLTTGQSCIVVAGSPFLLTANATGGTDLSALFSGSVSDGIGSPTPWSGTLTELIPNQTPLQVRNILVTGGSIAETFSMGINVPVTVPEPATLALLGLGLAVIGVARRKKLH